MKLTAMRGFSGSGKSTKAREIAEKTGAVVVSRDQLRWMQFQSYWTGKPTDEEITTIAEKAQVKALLAAGYDIVIDATHLNPKYLRHWARLASRMGAEFEIENMHADVDECKRRDHARMLAGGRYVGDAVIDQQVKRFPVEKWPTIEADPPFIVEPLEPSDWNGPPAIIVDIDGTVAHNDGHRSPYDYSRVLLDTPDHIIIPLVRDWKAQHPDGSVLFVSGRDDTCYPETLDWLVNHDVPVDWLFMRPAEAMDIHGGKLPDYVVKYDLFNFHIRGRFNVQFVLDDRDQVVDVWRRLGLKCLQVAPGDF